MPVLCRRVLRAGDLKFLSRLYYSIPRMFGVRILYVHVSGLLRRMDNSQALVCYVFGSIRRSSRVQFVVLLLFPTCVGSVHAILPGR